MDLNEFILKMKFDVKTINDLKDDDTSTVSLIYQGICKFISQTFEEFAEASKTEQTNLKRTLLEAMQCCCASGQIIEVDSVSEYTEFKCNRCKALEACDE